MLFRKPAYPILNRNHPFARSLAFDMPFYERGGRVFHDTLGRYIGKASNTTDPAWIRTPYGPGIQFTNPGGNNFIDVTSDRAGPIEKIRNLTVQAIVRSDGSVAGGSGPFITKGPFPNGTNGPYWEFRQDRSTNSWACDFDWGNNPGWGSTNGSNSGDGKFHNIFMSIGRLDNISAVPDFMVDGVISNSYAFSVAPTGSFVDDGNGFNIGTGDDSGTLNGEVAGSIVLLRVWYRILKEHERLMLTKDPWLIYRNSSRILTNSIAAAATSSYLSVMGVGS